MDCSYSRTLPTTQQIDRDRFRRACLPLLYFAILMANGCVLRMLWTACAT